jgi:hypothetical protein
MDLHIRDANQIRIMGSLANISRREAGEPRTLDNHGVHRAGRDKLGFGNATHFYEGAQKILDAFFFNECLEIVCQFCVSADRFTSLLRY